MGTKKKAEGRQEMEATSLEHVVGRLIQTRRQTMGMRLTDLANQMGGSPGESFLSRIEAGASAPSPSVTARIADALHLKKEALLNALGYASDEQRARALEDLRAMLVEPTPVVVSMPVMIASRPDAPESDLQRRSRLVRRKSDYFIVDLEGAPNEPFVGEAVVDRNREPAEGLGIVARVGDHLSAWTFHDVAGRKWIENGRGEKMTKGYTVLGVITRVTTERELVD